MITHINLIEGRPFRFTYGKLAVGLGSVVALALTLYGYQSLRFYLVKNSLSTMQNQITQMQSVKKQLMETAPPQAATGPHASLKSIFIQTPQWSNLLDALSENVPPTVWLTSVFASVRTPEGLEKSEKDGAEAAKITGPQMIVRGQSKQNSEIALFLERLQSLPFINRANLTQSHKEGESYVFTIECDMFLASR